MIRRDFLRAGLALVAAPSLAIAAPAVTSRRGGLNLVFHAPPAVMFDARTNYPIRLHHCLVSYEISAMHGGERAKLLEGLDRGRMEGPCRLVLPLRWPGMLPKGCILVRAYLHAADPLQAIGTYKSSVNDSGRPIVAAFADHVAPPTPCIICGAVCA